MGNWDKISLCKFQLIDLINANTAYDDFEKVMQSACVVFDKTEYEMNRMKPKKALRYAGKIRKIFQSPIEGRRASRIGKYRMLYDVSQVTFGQYVELAFFFQAQVTHAHRILASMSRPVFGKYKTAGHRRRAAYFLKLSVETVMTSVKAIQESLKQFNQEYHWLFGAPEEASAQGAKHDHFNQRYGWQYSASAIADYERIPLDQVYAMPVRQAFNDLAFLKEKVKYEVRERDRLMKEHQMRNNGR